MIYDGTFKTNHLLNKQQKIFVLNLFYSANCQQHQLNTVQCRKLNFPCRYANSHYCIHIIIIIIVIIIYFITLIIFSFLLVAIYLNDCIGAGTKGTIVPVQQKLKYLIKKNTRESLLLLRHTVMTFPQKNFGSGAIAYLLAFF